MNVRNLFLLLLASSIVAACGDATVDDDQPADAENGLETLNAKDDSFAIRPGSPEAKAVVDFLNQPLADDTAGEAFRAELDSVLYRRAADNIAAFRAGEDATFGTPDDLRFDDITQVDAIPFVGRSSLMRLFEMAEAAGYFQRASVDCADYLPHDRRNNYRIDSYADLLEVENSRCTTINGNLSIRIEGTDLLPPAARAVDHMRFLQTIDGNLDITTSTVFESLHFDNLQTVTGNIVAQGEGVHTVEFDSLEAANSIRLINIETARFPSLEYNDNIQLQESDYTGFTALTSVGSLRFYQRTEGTFSVDFPALVEAQSLQFNAQRINRRTAPNIAFEGGFDRLEKVASLTLTDGKYDSFEWPALAEVVNLRTTNTVDLFKGMPALRTVGGFTSQQDTNATSVHVGPPNLATATSISINTDLPVDGYATLTSVESSLSVTTLYGVEGFDALETVGGVVSLNIGRIRSEVPLSGFGSVITVGGLQVHANNTSVAVGEFFRSLEFTDGNVSLLSNSRFDTNPEFTSLLGIGGQLRIDSLRPENDMMPALEIVDGNVQIERTPQTFTGFDKLGHIEGTLTLRRGVLRIDGFKSLTSLGGNLVVWSSIDANELDAFLNQLEEFSGTITYN